jgi:hypothetical protein
LLAKTESLRPLVAALRRQHVVGRRLAPRIMSLAGKGPDELDDGTRKALAILCRGYTYMYRAHAAHEDIIFSGALRMQMEPADFAELGERVQAMCAEALGGGGLTDVRTSIGEVERPLGIEDLDGWTPEIGTAIPQNG